MVKCRLPDRKWKSNQLLLGTGRKAGAVLKALVSREGCSEEVAGKDTGHDTGNDAGRGDSLAVGVAGEAASRGCESCGCAKNKG